MKLLIVSSSVVPVGTGRYGGVELLVERAAEGYLKAGHRVTVAAPVGSKVPNGAELLETVNLPEEQDDDTKAGRIALKEFMVRADYDAIHDFSHRGAFHARQFPAIHMIWNPVTVRYDFQPDNKAVCLSNWQAARYKWMYGRDAVVGKTGFIDTSVYRPYPDERSDRFLFLGKLSPEKGPDLAIQYAQELDVPLDVVGGLIPSEAMNNAYVHGLVESEERPEIEVNFNVTEEEKVRFLKRAKALIYPVRQEEAHWLAGIEAWCMDTPTIVANRGAMKEINPARLVMNSKSDFLNRMKDITVDKGIRSWGEFARSSYSVEACVQFYTELLMKVSKGASW